MLQAASLAITRRCQKLFVGPTNLHQEGGEPFEILDLGQFVIVQEENVAMATRRNANGNQEGYPFDHFSCFQALLGRSSEWP